MEQSDVLQLEALSLDSLLQRLQQAGYTVIGPTIRDHVIVYDEIHKASDLPQGWKDIQEAGTYRLERRADDAYFGFQVGPQSWKKYLLPQRQLLWKATQDEQGFNITEAPLPTQKLALLGVRACELQAILIQDRILADGDFRDPYYAAQRDNLLLIAVECGEAGATCFCTSMGTGPAVSEGADICLTELLTKQHSFVVRAGSDKGHALLAQLALAPASPEQRQDAIAAVENARQQMGRTLDQHGLKDLLLAAWDHPQWQDIADRCLSCANCTMVCPTCFCTNVEDVTDLSGEHAERWRQWDSCFHQDFSYIHGGAMRPSVKSRYRQWMTHKLSSWFDQFGSSGCVGCGRCVTWCPAHIDITQEASIFQQSAQKQADHDTTKS